MWYEINAKTWDKKLLLGISLYALCKQQKCKPYKGLKEFVYSKDRQKFWPHFFVSGREKEIYTSNLNNLYKWIHYRQNLYEWKSFTELIYNICKSYNTTWELWTVCRIQTKQKHIKHKLFRRDGREIKIKPMGLRLQWSLMGQNLIGDWWLLWAKLKVPQGPQMVHGLPIHSLT